MAEEKEDGFLTRGAKAEDTEDEGEGLEEQYMKLFGKIGRDFVHKNDLESTMRNLLIALAPLQALAPLIPLIATGSDSGARDRAIEYKSLLDQNKLGTDVYKDLINMEE